MNYSDSISSGSLLYGPYKPVPKTISDIQDLG